MADGFLGIDEPSSIDKKIDAEVLTVGGITVYRERLQVAGTGAKDLADVSLAHGLEVDVTRIQSMSLEVAKGNVSGSTTFKRFGIAPDFDSGDNEIHIWDGADDALHALMSHTYSTSANIDSLSSSSGSDTEAIKVIGLDTNYDYVEQTITLTGQTRVALTTALIRVLRLTNVGSSDLVGRVYCFVNVALTGGVPNVLANIRSIIRIGNGQTTQTMYTVPNGTKAYLFSYFAVTQGARKATNIAVKLYDRPFGRVFTLEESHALVDVGTSHFNHVYKIPIEYLAKTDLKWTAQITESGITAAGVGAGFELLVVDD